MISSFALLRCVSAAPTYGVVDHAIIRLFSGEGQFLKRRTNAAPTRVAAGRGGIVSEIYVRQFGSGDQKRTPAITPHTRGSLTMAVRLLKSIPLTALLSLVTLRTKAASS